MNLLSRSIFSVLLFYIPASFGGGKSPSLSSPIEVRLEQKRWSEARNVAKEIGYELVLTGAAAGLIYYTQSADDLKAIFGKYANGMAGQFYLTGFLVQHLGSSVHLGWKTATQLLPCRNARKTRAKLTFLIDDYENKKLKFTEKTQKLFISIFDRVESLLDTDPNNPQVEASLAQLNRMLTIPRGMEDYTPFVHFNETKEGLSKNQSAVEDILADCDDDLRKLLRNAVREIHSTSQLISSNEPMKEIEKDGISYRNIFYVQGPPGVGKSYLIETLLTALGYHPRVVMFDEIDRDLLIGKSRGDFSIVEPGILAETLQESAETKVPPVLIFDEAGDVLSLDSRYHHPLKALIKKIADPRRRTISIDGLQGMEVPMDGWILFFIGTEEMTDPALLSRIPVIRLTKISPQKKMSIARKALDHILEKYRPETVAEITTQKKEIALSTVVDRDEKMGNPGMRIVKGVLQKWIKFEISKKSLLPPDENEEFDWDTAFAQQKLEVERRVIPTRGR